MRWIRHWIIDVHLRNIIHISTFMVTHLDACHKKCKARVLWESIAKEIITSDSYFTLEPEHNLELPLRIRTSFACLSTRNWSKGEVDRNRQLTETADIHGRSFLHREELRGSTLDKDDETTKRQPNDRILDDSAGRAKRRDSRAFVTVPNVFEAPGMGSKEVRWMCRVQIIQWFGSKNCV